MMKIDVNNAKGLVPRELLGIEAPSAPAVRADGVKIVTYTFDAGMHCPECTRELYAAGTTLKNRRTGDLYDTGPEDHRGVGQNAVDSEGHPVRPVFVTDSGWQGGHCDSCGLAYETFA